MAEEMQCLEATAEVSEALAAGLTSGNRRHRKDAAHSIAVLSHINPMLVVNIADVLVGALEMPEAQTRWECLDALSEVAKIDPESVAQACAGAEETLFDDRSVAAHSAAFRFLSCYGATSPQRSREVWPLMSDAIQCYHGNSEYRDMLLCLKDFAYGSVDADVLGSLARRMAYDAKNATGYIRAYSKEICEAARKGR